MTASCRRAREAAHSVRNDASMLQQVILADGKSQPREMLSTFETASRCSPSQSQPSGGSLYWRVLTYEMHHSTREAWGGRACHVFLICWFVTRDP